MHSPAPTYSQPAVIELTPLIERCIDSERMRNLSPRSLFEIRLHLGRFSDYCLDQGISSFQELNAALLKDFIMHTNPCGSPSQGKAIIWTLRKFFSYLALWNIVPSNPARALSHPKISPRHKLPQYLTAAQLRTFMTTAAESNSLQDFVVISLLATTGARPNEIVNLRMRDINCGQQCMFLHVKGNWYKRTPISAIMVELLEDYLESNPQTSEYLFPNQWGHPINVRWIERLVRATGEKAGFSQRITPRMLRHTFATYAADRHGITVTRALLGHCGTSHATNVYLHLVPSKYRRLMNCHPYQTTIDRGNLK